MGLRGLSAGPRRRRRRRRRCCCSCAAGAGARAAAALRPRELRTRVSRRVAGARQGPGKGGAPESAGGAGQTRAAGQTAARHGQTLRPRRSKGRARRRPARSTRKGSAEKKKKRRRERERLLCNQNKRLLCRISLFVLVVLFLVFRSWTCLLPSLQLVLCVPPRCAWLLCALASWPSLQKLLQRHQLAEHWQNSSFT